VPYLGTGQTTAVCKKWHSMWHGPSLFDEDLPTCVLRTTPPQTLKCPTQARSFLNTGVCQQVICVPKWPDMTNYQKTRIFYQQLWHSVPDLCAEIAAGPKLSVTCDGDTSLPQTPMCTRHTAITAVAAISEFAIKLSIQFQTWEYPSARLSHA
jgi:hypothetical protein